MQSFKTVLTNNIGLLLQDSVIHKSKYLETQHRKHGQIAHFFRKMQLDAIMIKTFLPERKRICFSHMNGVPVVVLPP